jgi:hypothetical protein
VDSSYFTISDVLKFLGPVSFPPHRARLDPPPSPILPLIFFPPSRARDTCLSFYHCCPAQAHGASAAPPPLSINQAARWVRARRFVVLHRSFSPGTPRARSISTFPRHSRTAPLDTAAIDSPPSVRIWPSPFFHEELKRLAQLLDSFFWSFGGLLQCVPLHRPPWPPPRG